MDGKRLRAGAWAVALALATGGCALPTADSPRTAQVEQVQAEQVQAEQEHAEQVQSEQVQAESATGAGVGTDPLTAAEEELARAAAASLLGVEAAAVRTAQVGAQTITAPAQELLLVERHWGEKGVVGAAATAGAGARQADLYLYRYADDVLIHAVTELGSGAMRVVEEARGVQLPLTEAERALATRIAFADPALFEWMQAEHRLVTGEELRGPEQVDVRAFVYHSGAAPESEPPEVAPCGMERCAQLLILTGNDVTYSVLPIVNLSRLRTASVVPLAVGGASPAAEGPHDHGAVDGADGGAGEEGGHP
jgi:hypothetical protein